MILWILLTVLLAWLVLMGAYWFHGRKGVGEIFPCGHPRKVCGVEAPVCPVCEPFLRGNPAVMGHDDMVDATAFSMKAHGDPNHPAVFGRPLFADKIDGIVYLTPEQMKEIQRDGKWEMVCRSCGKPMTDGQDTRSDCHDDPNHPAG